MARTNRRYDDYPNGYPQRNNQRSNQQSKKSGAKSGVNRNGTPYVQGWKASKQFGVISFICGPNKKTTTHQGKTQDWENWTCKISPKYAQSYLVNCLYSKTTGKVIIKQMGLVLNPKAPRGGYCGTFSNR